MSASLASLPVRRRNRGETEARLRLAVQEVLIEGGFGALNASAVARRAGVDKMLIYRYFGDLKGLIRQIAFGPDFFPSFDDLCGGRTLEAMKALPVSERTAIVLGNNARLLRERPVVLELMIWEMVERNEFTAIMEEARETLGLRLMADLYPDIADQRLLAGVSALLSAGVTYLVLRARKIRWYAGVNLKSEEGWAEVEAAIRALTASVEI
ncbi:MAG: TetR/AcrR family transcriptional regulator [Pseudomonadota bacterium]|nr:TetR/AcrR family transcriptional regulator [Pseudomonadota bacterium]